MSDLISRQAAIEAITGLPNCPNGFSDTYDKARIISELEEVPTIDAVEVVRCRDCKHRPIKVMEKNGNWLALPPRILDSELEYADDYACPCLNSDDYYYSWNPDLNWYCPNGERREP